MDRGTIAPSWSAVAMRPRALLRICAIHASIADRHYK
jgi:hypothetical protein